MATTLEHPDSFVDQDEPRSARVVLQAISDSNREFLEYRNFCDRIDRIIGAANQLLDGIGGGSGTNTGYYTDQEFDLFWSSMEIVKPAVYAKAPQPVVTPRFSDRNRVATVASELLERCLISSFDRSGFGQTMNYLRDDLIFAARGVTRIVYEDDDDDGKGICEAHIDRADFAHEPARKWEEVGWVAFAAYLTESKYRKRFKSAPLGVFKKQRNPTDGHRVDTAETCKVWEVWHKADNRVYWVTEGVDDFLDESEPFLKLKDFFPCPRPAYGTTRRRSLIPVPDYVRYERHLNQINVLTSRIYTLLDWVRVKGLIPSGGDIASAIDKALQNASDDVLFIAVPGAALTQGGGNYVQFLPLEEFANAVKGLIEARTQLINDFYQLSGVPDIMRGYVEAEEKLGQSQIKNQYGAARVREKIDELQRLARDVACINAEIICQKFTADELLDMSQMQIPTKAEIAEQVEELKSRAADELDQLTEKAKEKADEAKQQAAQQGKPIPPEMGQQAEQQFQQAQQQIIAKYQPQLKQLGETVVLEDVMKLIKDRKERGFTIEIETDSTIMTDEIAEKQSRAEFLQSFTNAVTAVQPLLMAGEAGAKLAGGMIKFALAPYRVGRELDGMIDDFVDAAPQIMAQQAGQQKGGEAEQAIAQANLKMADAELQKAQASIAKVQADAQGKMQEIQLRAAEAQSKAQAEQTSFALEMDKTRSQIEETNARIQLIFAEIQKMGVDAGNQTRQQDREDVRTVADIAHRGIEQQRAAKKDVIDAQFRANDGARADRAQGFAEQTAENEDTAP